MNKLYLFNSDSDLALADFTDHYMAPALIRQMSDELAVLPLWYADSGSGILAASAYNEVFMQQMKQDFGMEVDLVTWAELADNREWEIHPWGWNPAICSRLAKQGVSRMYLPERESLQEWRRLSGKNLALRVLEACKVGSQVCGTGACLFTVDDCRAYWQQQGNRCVFKAPWSGSGKGLLWCFSDFTESVAGWCKRTITLQGQLVGMPIYNKVCDFALEFHCSDEEGVRFAGYSFFETNAKGAYQGNWLASNERIEQRLAAYVSVDTLHRVCERVQDALRQWYSTYRGYLGVDMMICQLDNGQYAVCPCVEVNLRMNMGLVARFWADRYLHPSVEGSFRVEAFDTPQSLQAAHLADEAAFPLDIEGGKLRRGYLPLIPVTPRSRYRVFVKV